MVGGVEHCKSGFDCTLTHVNVRVRLGGEIGHEPVTCIFFHYALVVFDYTNHFCEKKAQYAKKEFLLLH
ncbi:hypothetical protein WS55_20910 [Burkholderia pseudomultivorans]|nr:hypothetical protein WS55_20910 [Burkholderia pseudomultivorans]KVC33462.1 hypothetical protein WS56_00575 [Burkholderia pseudomultivorans]